jgi:CPA2 family monovalent cation:H+ antiporter-2
MGSPSETTLIVLATAVHAGIVASSTAAFWQIATAIGLTITPLLAQLGRTIARRVDRVGHEPGPEADDTPRVLIIGFGRVGRVISDLLTEHDRAYIAVEADVDAVSRGRARGYNVQFGDAARTRFLERFSEMTISAVVLTMDDPVQQLRLVRRLRVRYPDVPIITRARDAADAAALYRAGASDAVPEALEGSLQMAEAVLVDVGVAVGPVIASVHDMRARVRHAIKDDADLDTLPRARTAPRRNAAASTGGDSG